MCQLFNYPRQWHTHVHTCPYTMETIANLDVLTLPLQSASFYSHIPPLKLVSQPI